MNWLSTILKFLNNIMGLKRKRPQVDSSAQKIIDLARADRKEARHENREADIDNSTGKEARRRNEKAAAKNNGIGVRLYRKILKQAALLNITFEQHWKQHPKRLKLLDRIGRKTKK